MLDMFDILEIPKEEPKEVEQFTPLEEMKTEVTEQNDNVSKQDYDNLVKTIEELKSLLVTNKE